jgi:hypothetical protein
MVLVALLGFGVLGWMVFRIHDLLVFSGQKVLEGVRKHSGRPRIRDGFELNGLPWNPEIDMVAEAVSALVVLATAVWAAREMQPSTGRVIVFTLLCVFDSFVAYVCTGLYRRFDSSK